VNEPVCPCCNKPLETAEQRWTHREPTILVTCRTTGCVLENVTATSEDMYVTFAPFIVEADRKLDAILDDARDTELWAYGLRPTIPPGVLHG